MKNQNLNLIYASRLYKLRREANLKQPVIAEFLGKSQQAYSKLERGETDFSDEVIDKICSYFKISLEDFTQTTTNINCLNSPNSATNIHNSQVNTNLYELLPSIMEEFKAMRDERKIYLNSFEKLITMLYDKK
jgi:transcriptional regulator with XRE-family HTH domain